LSQNPVLTTTHPQRHLIGVEVANAVRISALAGLASGVALLMVLGLAKMRGVGLAQ
jgi:hypothetical protein